MVICRRRTRLTAHFITAVGLPVNGSGAGKVGGGADSPSTPIGVLLAIAGNICYLAAAATPRTATTEGHCAADG